MNRILLGKGEQPVYLHAQFGTRHGLVAGATGTGKTVSLMVLAEDFSRIGVPVFMADVKGDVAGLAMPGKGGDKIQARVDAIGVEGYAPEANPVVFWDLYGKSGHPVRTTISELGPTLLGRILELSDAQVSISTISARCSRSSRKTAKTFQPSTASSARNLSRRFSADCCRSSEKVARRCSVSRRSS